MWSQEASQLKRLKTKAAKSTNSLPNRVAGESSHKRSMEDDHHLMVLGMNEVDQDLKELDPDVAPPAQLPASGDHAH